MILISACLLGCACRYDGKSKGNAAVQALAKEYQRDVRRGIHPAVPQHYFPGDDPDAVPPLIWRGRAHLLIGNWLNYFVYQPTPYNLLELKRK